MTKGDRAAVLLLRIVMWLLITELAVIIVVELARLAQRLN